MTINSALLFCDSCKDAENKVERPSQRDKSDNGKKIRNENVHLN